MSCVKPFLKWVGGKTQILSNILDTFPTDITNYHEPFVGGGSVLFGLLSKVRDGSITLSGNIYASDVNQCLISLYIHIQTNPHTFLKEIHTLIDEYYACPIDGVINRKPTTLEDATTSRESYYYWIRSKFNEHTDKTTVQSSSMFLFLNKTCFRGVYREGPRGFNVPYGHYKKPAIVNDDHIMLVSSLIQDVIFTYTPFTTSLSKVSNGDFIYLDPPYAPENDKSFVSYTSVGFRYDDHICLFDMIHTLVSELNVRITMSNASVDLVHTAFPSDKYVTNLVSCKRAINSKKPQSRTDEVIITTL